MATRARNRMTHTTETPTETTVSGQYPFRHSLDTGDKGVLVMWAQSKLAEHKHYNGPLDGRYDREVSLAVRQFQAEKGLKITGVIDRRTWEAL